MFASKEGSAGVVELLLQRGAQLDIKTKVHVITLVILFSHNRHSPFSKAGALSPSPSFSFSLSLWHSTVLHFFVYIISSEWLDSI